MIEARLISSLNVLLDTHQHESVQLFTSKESSRLPSSLYEDLHAGWLGRGGKVHVDAFCVPGLFQAVQESGTTRSEPRTAELCRNAVMLKAPETVALTQELKEQWLRFTSEDKRSRAKLDGTDCNSAPSRPSSQGWQVDSRWVDWPHAIAEAGSANGSKEHAKRRLAIGRYRSKDKEQERVVVVPMLGYWPDAVAKGLSEEREAILSLLQHMLDDCASKGQTLEIWAPVPLGQERGRPDGAAYRRNAALDLDSQS